MTTSVDLSFPGVPGKRTLKVKLGHRFMRRLHAATARNSYFTAAFMRVAGLVDPPEALMRPSLIFKVLRETRGIPRNEPVKTLQQQLAAAAAVEERAAA